MIRGVVDAAERVLGENPVLRDKVIALPRVYPLPKRFAPIVDVFRRNPDTAAIMVSVHANTNGGEARGTGVFYPPRTPGCVADSPRLAATILPSILKSATRFDPSWRRYSDGAIEAIAKDWPNAVLVRHETAAAAGMLEYDFNTRFYPVLIETGFIDNPQDAAWLARPDFQAAIGEAIATAVVSFILKYV